MKANSLQLECVEFERGMSYKLFSPRLRNTFLWHYHPEFELLYVEADAGIRHVGRHISTYTKSDLVFIGGNLPHLNFDYRLRTDYHQIVIQLKIDFLGEAISTAPEFAAIRKLFAEAQYGIAFNGEIKIDIAQKLKGLNALNNFDRLLTLIAIFQQLAESEEKTVLNKDINSYHFILKDKVRMGTVYEYIGLEYNRKPDVNTIAEKVSLTTPAFCRYFKRQTNMTFTEFVNQYRIERAKNLLIQNNNVSETCYQVGIESISYFNKLFKQIVGQNPSDFKRQWARTIH